MGAQRQAQSFQWELQDLALLLLHRLCSVGAAYLHHTYLCVPVLAGWFCNMSHTVAGTNTTYVPDSVSMPCSINRENCEMCSAFYENRKKPKYVGCEILIVAWHHYPSCTAGVNEEKRS